MAPGVAVEWARMRVLRRRGCAGRGCAPGGGGGMGADARAAAESCAERDFAAIVCARLRGWERESPAAWKGVSCGAKREE